MTGSICKPVHFVNSRQQLPPHFWDLGSGVKPLSFVTFPSFDSDAIGALHKPAYLHQLPCSGRFIMSAADVTNNPDTTAAPHPQVSRDEQPLRANQEPAGKHAM